MKDLSSVEKRRKEIWILTIIFLIALIGAVIIMVTPVKIFLGGWASIDIDPFTLRLGAASFFLLVVCYIVQNELKNRTLFRMLVEDRVAIEALGRRVSELSGLNRISSAVTSVRDMGALYEIIMDSALKLMNAENFSLLMEEEGCLRIKASRGLDDAVASSTRVRPGEGIAGWVAETGEPVILDGPVRDARFRSLVPRDRSILSSISVPVKLRGRVLGVMCVSNISTDYNFTRNDMQLLSIFANQVAIALENHSLLQELQESLEDCRRGQERLIQSAKLSALGELISGVLHELNNRLSPIIAYAELLRDRAYDGETDRYVGTIYRSAVGASKLLRSLSSFAKEREAAMEYVDLNEVMERVLGMMDYQLRVLGIRVMKELSPELPRTMADPFQMEEVFFNVVKNALLSIEASPGRIELKSRAADGTILFEVSDDGVGIPEEDLPRIFDPFFTNRKGEEGTGLGLSVCYGILRVHDGDIWVFSEEGKGTTVKIELPVRQMAPGASLKVKKRERAPGPTSLKILVVDDEEIIRQLITDILSKGNAVEAVGTVDEALRMIDEGDFDLIIADFRMPNVDGIQFYGAVSERRPSLKSRMLFITGDPTSTKIRDFLDRTGNRCISKPFSIEKLFEACRELVDPSSRGLS